MNTNSAGFQISFPINFTKAYHGILSSTKGFISGSTDVDEGAYISLVSTSTLHGFVCWGRQTDQWLYINALGV